MADSVLSRRLGQQDTEEVMSQLEADKAISPEYGILGEAWYELLGRIYSSAVTYTQPDPEKLWAEHDAAIRARFDLGPDDAIPEGAEKQMSRESLAGHPGGVVAWIPDADGFRPLIPSGVDPNRRRIRTGDRLLQSETGVYYVYDGSNWIPEIH